MFKSDQRASLLTGPEDITALVGDRVLLKATYIGQPQPTVLWRKSGKILNNDERTSITCEKGASSLLLQKINTDDSGKYEISVENIYGKDCDYASVSVEGPPDPPSGKPIAVSHTNSATITWNSPPYDGGKIITGFLLEYSLLNTNTWMPVELPYCLNYSLCNLQPGGEYIFRIRAKNIYGCSISSLESDPIQMEEMVRKSSLVDGCVTIESNEIFKSNYDVLEELGKGRYGIVYKVVDKNNQQHYAGKFIRCRASKDREKVLEEIAIMNLLRHNKLLQLFAAYENTKETIMITEYISGGELFERVVADDFTLTERDCIIFMRQICEGVAYMHSKNIVHLDLKPENIMCFTRTSHELKIIDFGLAQKLIPNMPIRVLFGTPEFIPPEIINYEPIGTQSDMWSVGVICYVLLSGLSPFMGDNDAETFANITRAYYDFDDEAFNAITENARDFIGSLLIKRKENRLSAENCLNHKWLDSDFYKKSVILSTDKLKKFIIRRKWQKTGNAIRALGRMATLSATRRNLLSNSVSYDTTPHLKFENEMKSFDEYLDGSEPDILKNSRRSTTQIIFSNNDEIKLSLEDSAEHAYTNEKIDTPSKNVVGESEIHACCQKDNSDSCAFACSNLISQLNKKLQNNSSQLDCANNNDVVVTACVGATTYPTGVKQSVSNIQSQTTESSSIQLTSSQNPSQNCKNYCEPNNTESFHRQIDQPEALRCDNKTGSTSLKKLSKINSKSRISTFIEKFDNNSQITQIIPVKSNTSFSTSNVQNTHNAFNELFLKNSYVESSNPKDIKREETLQLKSAVIKQQNNKFTNNCSKNSVQSQNQTHGLTKNHATTKSKNENFKKATAFWNKQTT